MARIEYTWTRCELYNKDGVQILIARANEDNRKKRWIKIENGVETKVTHEEAAEYIDPDYKKRIEKRRQRAEVVRKNRNGSTYKMAAFEYGMPWA
jgi:hypothetical protein